MLIAGFPAGPWGTNCWVVATGSGSECVIIDPGMDAAADADKLITEHRLKPVAVLATHGHVDHVWSVAPLAGAYDTAAWIHPADRHLLTDPMAGLSPESAGLLAAFGATFTEPDDVRELVDGAGLDLAGVRFDVEHTPGHTQGSVVFRLPAAGPDGAAEVLFAGDLLFAGSIGRTDMPGGNHDQMLRSLAATVLPLDDTVVVLPGHGPSTTVGHERATNPYLSGLAE
ncbi:MAG: MBL fold metallo-hydrolase [Nocardioidaceae bacterium]|nr:MBL fold metallo-hydrolase [Nocardioidaceae bacterium]